MRRVCFVTDELAPLTPGGIGKLIANLMADSVRVGADVEFHVGWVGRADLLSNWPASFPCKVHFHLLSRELPDRATLVGDDTYPGRAAYRFGDFQSESVALLLGLSALERQVGPFDDIEFPDFRGWSWASSVAKRLGYAFASTRLGVRLHSTASILDAREGPSLNWLDHCRIETERLAIELADVVIAHLPEIINTNQRFYGFDEQWRSKVVVEFPPLVEGAQTPRPVALTADAPVVFGTKIQRLKQPDVFVKGVAEFMREHAEWRGKAMLVCHEFDREYGASIRALVPREYAQRFVFAPPGPERTALMRPGAVWVVPSSYESLNLTAYEASLGGATLVLNGLCPAFGPGSPFIEGESAWLFDGTPTSLASALQRAFTRELPRGPRWQVDRPWFERPPEATLSVVPTTPRLDVTVRVAKGINVWTTVSALVKADVPFTLTLSCDDSVSDEATHRARLAATSLIPADHVKLVTNAESVSLDDAWRLAISRGEFSLLLEEGMTPTPSFIRGGVNAMARDAALTAVVPTVAFVPQESVSGTPEWFATFVGHAPSLSLREHCVMHPYSIVRSGPVGDASREVLDAGLAWSMGARLSQAGARVLAVPAVGLVAPSVHEHAVYGDSPTAALVARVLSTLDGTHPGTRWASLLSNGDRTHTVYEAGAQRHSSLVDLGNEALKRFPGAHRAAKSVIQGLVGGGDQQVPLRHRLAGRIQRLVGRS